MKFKSIFFLIFLALFICSFSSSSGGEATIVPPYKISVIYQYGETISAVDIIKNTDVSDDDILVVTAKDENGEHVRVTAVPIEEALPTGTSEITISDFKIAENHKIYVTIWDDLTTLTPLTDGTNPTVTIENRVAGSEKDWVVSPDGKRIVSYTGNETDVVIPNYIGQKHITTVAPYSTPDNMFSIFGDRALEITSFKISDGIKVIGPTTFANCKNVSNDLYLPPDINYIGAYAFYNCINMTGDVAIPEGVQYVNPASFAGCYKITSLTLPESLVSIGSYAFYCCNELAGELKIPEKVTRIEDSAFAYCKKLTGNISLPNVVHIGNNAFVQCNNFNGTISIPNAEHIGNNAFLYCEGIKGNLSIPSATYIGNCSFAKCSKLNGKLELSDNLEYIGYSAFENCPFTGMLTLPDSLIHIGDAAFNHCKYFDNETLLIPENVRTLGGDRNVSENTYYSTHLFYDFCRKNEIKAYGVAPENKYFCAKDGVLYNSEMTRLIAYPFGKSNEVFEIPEGVTQIDELSFGHCTNLKELVLPDSYVIKQRAPENVVNRNGNTLAVALYSYTGVEKISVKDSNPNYISKNGALYSKDGKTLWYCPVRIGTSYSVEPGTEIIETGAIYGEIVLNTITRFEIPESVRYISPDTITYINYLFKENIYVDENNPYYCVINGRLKAVN